MKSVVMSCHTYMVLKFIMFSFLFYSVMFFIQKVLSLSELNITVVISPLILKIILFFELNSITWKNDDVRV